MREWFDRLGQNLRYAARVLARTPSFTLTAVGSLALGVAVNTTMFSVVSSLLLRPLGMRDDLVRIGRSAPGEREFRSASYDDYTYLRAHATSFASITGHQLASLTMGADDATQQLSAEWVAQDYFATLGVAPRRGRAFTADESRVPSGIAVAIISDRFWHRRLASDSSIVGRRLPINGQLFDIVGIAPPGFTGTFPGVDIDVWIPAGMAWIAKPPAQRNTDEPLLLLGRLRDGVTAASAEAELDALAPRIVAANRDGDGDRRFVLAAARGAHPLFAKVLRVFLSMLMALMAVVLLIACANVAGMLLARAGARRGEVAIRLAIGASRAQVIGQLLVESLFLGVLGGAGGMILSIWLMRLLNGLSFIPGPTGAGVYFDLRLDTRVLAFTAVVSVLTAIVFGLVPALRATRVGLTDALRDPRSTGGGTRFRLGRALVVVQVCASFVLLVGATLLFRSLRNVDGVDVGFNPDRVFVATVDLSRLGYDRARVEQFQAELLSRTRQLPGVEHAALASFVALSQGDGHPIALRVVGADDGSERRRPTVAVGRVTDGYFATVQQRIVRGRDFISSDATGARVAIVNEAMARRYWPGGDALGKRIGLGEDLEEHEIVGIAGNARFSSFGGEIQPFAFLPVPNAARLHLRVTEPANALQLVRRVVQEIDPRAVTAVAGQSMRENMSSSMSLVPVKIVRVVFGVAGVIALLLATGGLYGLVTYTLEQRMKEIGIRTALGATRLTVFRVIVGGAFRLTAIGLLVGMAMAAWAMRLLANFLYGLSPMDPATFGGIAALLALVTLGAGYAAARRGLNVDPMAILRYE